MVVRTSKCLCTRLSSFTNSIDQVQYKCGLEWKTSTFLMNSINCVTVRQASPSSSIYPIYQSIYLFLLYFRSIITFKVCVCIPISSIVPLCHIYIYSELRCTRRNIDNAQIIMNHQEHKYANYTIHAIMP